MRGGWADGHMKAENGPKARHAANGELTSGSCETRRVPDPERGVRGRDGAWLVKHFVMWSADLTSIQSVV